MASTHVNSRAQKRRDALHPVRMLAVEIRAPDTQRSACDRECRRQFRLVGDMADKALQRLMDAAFADISNWTR